MLDSADAQDTKWANRSAKEKTDYNRDEAVYQQNVAREKEGKAPCY